MDFIQKENILPFVSVLLVTRNEKNYVELALMSLLEQSYPKDRYEIIIVDGESTDGTLTIIEKFKFKYSTKDFSIRIFQNPKQILAAGWNIGIKKAKGDYVVRIDAHARAKQDFIMNSVKAMLKVDVECVGGKLITKTINGNNDTISKVLSSPFGVGNSSFRVSERAGYVDTAVYGLYKKSIFDKVGFFNEKYVRNQDLQMHSRIRKSGGRFYFDPEIKCDYYARNTVKKMIKQAFQNGIWNMVLMKEDRTGLSARHLVPFVFVGFLILSSIGGIFMKPIWFLEIGIVMLHLILGLIFGIKSGAKGKEKFEMPLLFLLLHITYGTGYLAGILK